MVFAIFWGAIILLGAGSFLIAGLFTVMRWIVARPLTPEGHRRLGSYKESKGAKELLAEGYGITPDWRSDAVARVPKS
jgi:hypothetical protein